MIISAFTIETDTIGFAKCWWPVNSKKEALKMALELSIQAIGNKKYLSSFW